MSLNVFAGGCVRPVGGVGAKVKEYVCVPGDGKLTHTGG